MDAGSDRELLARFSGTAAEYSPDTRDWSELEPVIDAAVESLPTTDREAVLLRYYHNRSHAEVGRRLNLTEDAARMRVQRALEKLRLILARQGVTTTAAALALTLPLHAAQAAPTALVATVSIAAANAAGVHSAAHTFSTTLTVTKSHLAATTKALGGWALTQPAAAAAWINQLPASEADGSPLKSVTGPWTAQAPAAAAEAWASRTGVTVPAPDAK